MKSHSERGIALITTLIMLSVVTLMAVVFLSISRREKASVNVTHDLTTAKLMADAGLERAKAQVLSRIFATTNNSSFDLLVSTNYQNPLGFYPNVRHPTNVNYFVRRSGEALRQQDQLLNVANLLYDPRPPVFIPVRTANGDVTNDFRFYLDLNRNGLYEPSGWQPVQDAQGRYYDVEGNLHASRPANPMLAHVAGDPEWIGVLERPDLPHSSTNRFVGRTAFIVMPAGKSLDLNHIHNYARSGFPADMQTAPGDAFFRNQGVGSWEINLAAFLRDLNTNIWTTYEYYTNLTRANEGFAFQDAWSILRYRYRDNLNNLSSLRQLYGNSAIEPILTAPYLDLYSQGLLNNPDRPWSGSESLGTSFTDVQELFSLHALGPQFLPLVNRMERATTNSLSTYDRYTFYRMLAQLGTDSRPAEMTRVFRTAQVGNNFFFQRYPTNRLHLHYRNSAPDGQMIPEGQTNFIRWGATNAAPAVDFFHAAADRLLRASLQPTLPLNQPASQEQFLLMGDRPVRNDFSVTNIQVWPVNEYSATVHRLLQKAANIYDATTSRPLAPHLYDYPTVFRPVLTNTATNVYISRFVEVIDYRNELNSGRPWRDLRMPQHRQNILPADHFIGVPWVIGAKRGFPAFNEFNLDTVSMVSRKLEVRKPTINSVPNVTNQMYVVGISNIFGLEAWNSYAREFQANVEMRVTNNYSMTLWHEFPIGSGQTNRLWFTNDILSATITTNQWAGSTNLAALNNPDALHPSFIIPINTNVVFLTNSIYQSSTGQLIPVHQQLFDRSFQMPRLFLTVTNQLQFIMVDQNTGRVLDFVNLDNLSTHIDITRRLTGDVEAGAGGVFSDRRRGAIAEGDLWNPQHVVRGAINTPTEGILAQMAVSRGDPRVSDEFWRSSSGDLISGRDKENAIAAFNNFFRVGGTNINLAMQAPFSPTRKIFERRSWQVNDPLVRFTKEDLSDPVLTGSENTENFGLVRPPNAHPPPSNIGRLNERFRPWGGNPLRAPDNTSFSMAIKDPGVLRSDDWRFPTNKFPSIGWLGRVHRGTPWQTIYLKSEVAETNVWAQWSGSRGTHPTNDWRLLDLFTVAPNNNAARGLLSVNQTNQAAWSAVLSGVNVLTNHLPAPNRNTNPEDLYRPLVIEPGTLQVSNIVAGIQRARDEQPFNVFSTLGEVLATPELTVASPFLDVARVINSPNEERKRFGLTDAAVERIPQQILSLLRTDEPHLVVYSFGQALRPAENSLVTSGPFYGLCTNYQVTAEYFMKTVLRVEDILPGQPGYQPLRENKRVVVERFNIVMPDEMF